jgi:hypothetical protein
MRLKNALGNEIDHQQSIKTSMNNILQIKVSDHYNLCIVNRDQFITVNKDR